MDYFEEVNREINNGLEGKNKGIPMGFNRLNRYIGIRKRIYTFLFGPTGCGKSAFLHSAYILNPIDYMLANKDTDVKLHTILFSMERSKVYILTKWLSRKIFLEEGIFIPIQVILGWWEDRKLTKDEHDLVLQYADYLSALEDYVDIIEGPQNPTGIYKYVKAYAESHGTIEKVDDFHKIYHPTNENHIVQVAADHLGLMKLEGKMEFKKQAIDKTSEYFQFFRDIYGYFITALAQVTRGMSNPMFSKMESFEPTMDDAKESGRPGEDCDVGVSIFDPIRYHTKDDNYNVDKFIDTSNGANYFRKIKILKNTFGEDQIKVGMGFFGAIGVFKELDKSNKMDDFNYEDLFNHSFFLNK